MVVVDVSYDEFIQNCDETRVNQIIFNAYKQGISQQNGNYSDNNDTFTWFLHCDENDDYTYDYNYTRTQLQNNSQRNNNDHETNNTGIHTTSTTKSAVYDHQRGLMQDSLTLSPSLDPTSAPTFSQCGRVVSPWIFQLCKDGIGTLIRYIYHYDCQNNTVFTLGSVTRNDVSCPNNITVTQPPTYIPTMTTHIPSVSPSVYPTQFPSLSPTVTPTITPTKNPTSYPSHYPTSSPSLAPTNIPTLFPTMFPTIFPTIYPTNSPSSAPSNIPTIFPTQTPSITPSQHPSLNPSITPTNTPTMNPTINPTSKPTDYPSLYPSVSPSKVPSNWPSSYPSSIPTQIPSATPTGLPSNIPTNAPSLAPSITPTTTPTTSPFGANETIPCFQNDRYPTTQLYLTWCKNTNQTIYQLFINTAIANNSKVDELYSKMKSFAVSFTSYVKCSVVQKDYNISDSQLILLILYQSSQLSLLLKTKPITKFQLTQQLSIVELLTYDLSSFGNNISGTTNVYSADYTASMVNFLADAVDFLAIDAIAAKEPVNVSTAGSVVGTLSNVQKTRKYIKETAEVSIAIADSMKKQLNTIGQSTLIDSQPNSTYIVQTEMFSMQTSRFVAKINDSYVVSGRDFSETLGYNYDLYSTTNCGNNVTNVTLSEEYISQLIDGYSMQDIDQLFMDCTLIETKENIYSNTSYYDTQTNQTRAWISTFLELSVNIPLELQAAISKDHGGTLTTIAPSNSRSHLSVNLSACQVITFYLYLLEDKDKHYPQCVFWNDDEKEWDPTGCYVLESGESYVICACDHASYFASTSIDFEPTLNIVTEKNFHEFTASNLWKYPVGWITIVLILIVASSYHVWFHKFPKFCGNKNKFHTLKIEENKIDSSASIEDKTNKSKDSKNRCQNENTSSKKFDKVGQQLSHSVDTRLILHDCIARKEDYSQSLFVKYRIGKDDKILKDPNLSKCEKIIRLSMIAIMNDHPYFLLCCRDPGNGITLKQIILVLLLRILTMMAVNAVFYGNSQKSALGDAYIAILGGIMSFIPPLVVKNLFQSYVPISYQHVVPEHSRSSFSTRSLSITQRSRRSIGANTDNHDTSDIKSAKTPTMILKLRSRSQSAPSSQRSSKQQTPALNSTKEINTSNYQHAQQKQANFQFKKYANVGTDDIDDIDELVELKEIETITNIPPQQSTNINTTKNVGVESAATMQDTDEIEAKKETEVKATETRTTVTTNKNTNNENTANVETRQGANGDVSIAGTRREICNTTTTGTTLESDRLSVFSRINEQRISGVRLQRDSAIEKIFKLSGHCWIKYVTWLIVVLWIIFCILLILIFALRFDQISNDINLYQFDIISQCNYNYNQSNYTNIAFENIDISEITWINYNATESELRDELNNYKDNFVQSTFNSSLNNNSSIAWFLSLLLSTMISIVGVSPVLICGIQCIRVIVYKDFASNASNREIEYFNKLFQHFEQDKDETIQLVANSTT